MIGGAVGAALTGALSHQAGYGRALAIVALLPLGGAAVAIGQRPDVT